MSKEFKAGDKVYYPLGSTKVLTVYKYDIPCEYPIYVSEHNYNFTLDGKIYIEDARPSIYHATPEMKAKLEDFYGIEFEAPPVKPTSREIIEAKLNKSTKPVPCWVSNDPNCTQPTRKDAWAFIHQVCDDGRFSEFPYLDATGKHWKYATPFDHTTLQPITELPKGEYYE